MVWQSITYAQSHFQVGDELVRPAFVADYTPSDLDRMLEEHLRKLLALGMYGNVGRIHFYGDGSWAIRFANIYARSGLPSYLVNPEQLPRRRVGSV